MSITRHLLIWLVLSTLLLSGCTRQNEALRFHVLSHQEVDGPALQEIFLQQAGIEIALAHSRPGQSALEALRAGEADLALVSRTHPFTPGVRAIMPVYKSVLHLLAREGIDEEWEGRSLRDKRIYIANNSLAGHRLIRAVAERQGLQPGDYQLLKQHEAGVTDLIVYLGPINAASPFWQGRGYRLVSAAEDAELGGPVSRDSLGFLVPGMDPMEIPAQTYQIPGNEVAIPTLAVDTLLVTRKDLPVNLVYLLTETLFEHKPRFTAISPSLFSAIHTDFDPLALNFPLHEGARRYLERNEPGFLERYAETINMLVYLAFLLITGFLAVARWNAHRKKDRIDTFYSRALAIREQANGSNSDELRRQLFELEQEAFASLIAEKLAANESFRIFTDLLGRIHRELDD